VAKGLHARNGKLAVEYTRCGYRGGVVDAEMEMLERQEEAARRWNRSVEVTPA
jgi:hypothetical protein